PINNRAVRTPHSTPPAARTFTAWSLVRSGRARNCRWSSTRFWLALVSTSLAALSSQVSAQSLREAVEQATQTDPEVLLTTNRRLAADQGLKQANAGYLPRVDLTAGIGPERLNTLDSRAAGMSDKTINRHDAALP